MSNHMNNPNGISIYKKEKEEEEEEESLDLANVINTSPLPPAKLIKNSNLSIVDSASLTYFTNPQYMNILQRKTKCNASDNSDEIKFYKKRIISLFKDILRDQINENEKVNVEIKEIHSMFVNASINYFQMIDTKDIIQGQHPKHVQNENMDASSLNVETTMETPEDILNNIGGKEILTVNDANDLMMRKTIAVSNLDNYVISSNPDTNTTNEMRFIPLKLEIDLKTNDLKKKGVKDKIKKEKNNNPKPKSKFKKEDLSNEIV